MRTYRLAVVASLGVVLGLAPRDEGVRFGSAPLARGARFVVTSDTNTRMASTIVGLGEAQNSEASTRTEYAYSVGVTAVAADGPNEATVKIDRAHVSGKVEATDIDQDVDASAMGRTRQATRTGATWTFKELPAAGAADPTPAATPVEGEAAVFLATITNGLLATPPLASTLSGKALKFGDKVTVKSADAALLFDAFAMGISTRSLDLEFTATRKQGDADVAVFTAKAVCAFGNATGPAAGPADSFELSLTGELAVDPATCRLRSGSLTGPLSLDKKIDDDPSAVTLSMTGQITCKFANASH